jgi:hypothetical protein
VDRAEDAAAVVLGQLPPLHGPVEGLLDPGLALLDPFVVDLDVSDLGAGLGADLDDAGPHDAAADHADLLDVLGIHPDLLRWKASA